MIEWKNEYNMDISVIDREHMEFIDIINRAIAAKQEDKAPDEILNVLNEMTAYAQRHFKTEEDYMIKFNFSEYQYHKEEHLDFSFRTMAYLNRVVNCDFQVSNEILEYLKRWLVRHILGTDKRYVKCFIKNGLK